MKIENNLQMKALLVIFLIGMALIIMLQALLHSEMSPSRSLSWTTTVKCSIDNSKEITEIDYHLEEMKRELLELKNRVKELQTIKATTLNELQYLGKQHYKSRDEIKQLSTEKIAVTNDLRKSKKELFTVKKSLGALQSAFALKQVTINIPIAAPKMPMYLGNAPKHTKKNITKLECMFSTCFDHSLCPLLSGFPIFVHPPINNKLLPFDFTSSSVLYRETSKMPFFTDAKKKACVFMVIIVIDDSKQIVDAETKILAYLKSLSTWRNNGQNHLVLFSMKNTSKVFDCKYTEIIAKTQAAIVSPMFCPSSFRSGFDVLFHQKSLVMTEEEPWQYLPPLVPMKRKYLFTLDTGLSSSVMSDEDLVSLNGDIKDVFVYRGQGCTNSNQVTQTTLTKDCKSKAELLEILRNSVFHLLVNVNDYSVLLDEIIMSLKVGAIPVLIGEAQPLPFEDLIDFNKAMLVVPAARITETHFILRTMKTVDVFAMRHKGRFIFETYFSSLVPQLKSVFAIFQHRLKLPPTALSDYTAKPLYGNITVSKDSNDLDTQLSPKFAHNWTVTSVNYKDVWNNYPGGHYLVPYSPKLDVLPSSVQFVEKTMDYMPIGNGEGGDGKIFMNALGGDQPIEHFTIIILTYDRELILTESLQRLTGLKYLNRVIVIWNNPVMPSVDLDWPDIGVPVHVVKGEKNSLNNRFLPYDLIDTEAVLSMDDDIYLRHDEIELAFRVWRENRDRIVGFPGRYHSWNATGNSWSYVSSVACELSMVLTGGAFFHKYYSYLYTYLMPSVIRDMVDDYMNCEDIAMNFLVAHVTNKQPIKVTSRWTFRCPGCPSSLSSDHSHYLERTKCINFFQKVYGYLPLKRTQFRADSVLFKTRLPAGKHKCYRFV